MKTNNNRRPQAARITRNVAERIRRNKSGPQVMLLILVAVLIGGCSLRAASILGSGSTTSYAPLVLGSLDNVPATPVPTATPGPSPTPTTTPGALPPPLPAPTVVVAIPPIDYAKVRQEAQTKGLDLAFNKIGFHVAVGGNQTGLGDWMKRQNDAGVPFFLKSADAGGPLFEAQQLMKADALAGKEVVPHILIYRGTPPELEAPYYNYNISPEVAAQVSWQVNRDAMPKELDKSIVWLETLNEPGRIGNNGLPQVERLGRFSLATAKLAVAEGYKYAALSWSTGVPEREDWENPAMLEFLRYAGEHPDEVAISIHEYSLENDEISRFYPALVGRFQMLFDVCDEYGIPRPTVLITEWGWEYNTVPQPAEAMEDIAWAAWLYAAYPEVKGAAIWYLGPGFSNIHHETQRLIAPMTDFSLSHYYIYTPGIGEIDAEIFRPSPPTRSGEDDGTRAAPYPRPQLERELNR